MESESTTKFVGKRVLVTGAGRGIGRAIVQELHRQGAKVYAVSKTRENLDSLEKELQTNLIPICVDLLYWKETEAALGNLECMDALINNAGIQEAQDFLRVAEEQFDNQMNVNVKAVLHVSQIIARKMMSEKRAGRIVNINSIVGFLKGGKKAFPNAGIYCTTKAALDMLSKVMAIELGPHKITVNSVSLGLVATDFTKAFVTQTASVINVPVETVRTALIKSIASKSVSGEPFIEMKQIVEAVLFLASGGNGQITGADIHVDDGFLVL